MSESGIYQFIGVNKYKYGAVDIDVPTICFICHEPYPMAGSLLLHDMYHRNIPQHERARHFLLENPSSDFITYRPIKHFVETKDKGYTKQRNEETIYCLENDIIEIYRLLPDKNNYKKTTFQKFIYHR